MPACRFKPIRPSFIFGIQIKIFFMKSEFSVSEPSLTWKRRNCWSRYFCAQKYSCSFIKLRLNHWCHMDYFNNVLTTFLGLEHVSCIAGRRYYGFENTLRWVINDRIFSDFSFFGGWIILLKNIAKHYIPINKTVKITSPNYNRFYYY